MDLGITRTIDQAIYIAINSLAILLWRIDAALLSVSVFSYQSTDWLVNPTGGGLWTLLSFMTGADGVFGLALWQLFVTMALGLYGFSKIVRIFYPWPAVEPGKMLFLAVVTWLFISQGNAALQSAERVRGEASNLILSAMASAGISGFDFGGHPASAEPMPAPADLDGVAPLRAWETVASTYFLVADTDEMHRNIPPDAFRQAYCLYDPTLPVGTQDAANPTDGCSPQLAWDEWDFNLAWELPAWLGGSGIITLPLYNEHPENREMAIRDAQSGAARLALGLPVALFPVLEAQVGLLLTLAATFIYLTLPVALFFGLFRFAESMPTRLMLQYITVFVRTVIIHGLVAVFLALLMGAAATGNFSTYLGIIGVGLFGGWFLISMAMATMRETLGQALGMVSGVVTGVSTGAFGEAGRQPAQMATGAAKVAGAAAVGALALSGAGTAGFDLAEPVLRTGKAGLDDLGVQTPQVGSVIEAYRHSPLPDRLSGLAWPGKNEPRQNDFSGLTGVVVPATVAAVPVAVWAGSMVEARQEGRGLAQARETGRGLLGEELARQTEPVLGRYDRETAQAALQTAGAMSRDRGQDAFITTGGELNQAGVNAVRAALDPDVRRIFEAKGAQGERDLAVLTAAGVQPVETAEPADFRRAVAEAKSGVGKNAPGRTTPQALGLDAVAAGAHYGAINRFVRLSDEAGLSVSQRERLLAEAQRGEISEELRIELEAQLRQRPAGPELAALVSGAEALPESLSGPRRIQLPPEPNAVQSPGRPTVAVAGASLTTKPAPDEAGKETRYETERALREGLQTADGRPAAAEKAQRSTLNRQDQPANQPNHIGDEPANEFKEVRRETERATREKPAIDGDNPAAEKARRATLNRQNQPANQQISGGVEEPDEATRETRRETERATREKPAIDGGNPAAAGKARRATFNRQNQPAGQQISGGVEEPDEANRETHRETERAKPAIDAGNPKTTPKAQAFNRQNRSDGQVTYQQNFNRADDSGRPIHSPQETHPTTAGPLSNTAKAFPATSPKLAASDEPPAENPANQTIPPARSAGIPGHVEPPEKREELTAGQQAANSPNRAPLNEPVNQPAHPSPKTTPGKPPAKPRNWVFSNQTPAETATEEPVAPVRTAGSPAPIASPQEETSDPLTGYRRRLPARKSRRFRKRNSRPAKLTHTQIPPENEANQDKGETADDPS